VSKVAINVVVVVALAAAVFALPGGGEAADLVVGVLSTLVLMSLVLFGWRMYREHRIDLYSLGDPYRGALYAAAAAIVFALAGRVRLLETGAGTIVWFAVVGAAVYALYRVYQQWRSNAY
jgi:tellurite resistance protein TehA-like permease